MAKKTAGKYQALQSRRETVAPVNVVKLMGILGGTKTAAELGVSTTLLYKSKNENAITKSIELAAAHALENLGAVRPPAVHTQPAVSQTVLMHGSERAFFVTIAGDKADMFQRMAQAMGASVVAA